MLQRRRRKDNISPKSHPSLTFINNLLHSKSTYFYKWWVNKNSDVYNSKRFSQQHSVKLSKSNPTGRDFDPLQPGYNALWKKRNWSYLLPTFCILALLVGLYSFINPTTHNGSTDSVLGNSILGIDSSMLGLGSNKAYAEEGIAALANSNGTIGTRSGDNNVSMTITPDTSSSGGSSSGTIDATVGQTAYSNHIVKLAGDRIKSYVLSISYTNDSTALVNNSTNTEEGAINSTITGANNKTGDNLDSNTWGYSWSDNTSTSSNTLTYHTMPISTNPATIKSATEGTIPNNTLNTEGKLAFAVKFGDKAVAGHYTTNVLLSLAIQPAEVVKTLSSITNMQEMTSAICNASTEHETKQLKDTRDNKLYWVTKLKDGNCWMTQNLDFDIKVLAALDPPQSNVNPATSDVSSYWSESSNPNYPPTTTKTGNINTGWSNTQTAVQSWDPGNYYYKYVSATDWTNCGTSLSNMSTCPSKGNWTTTAPAAEGQHYHVGNYYSWNAATAGTGGSITSGQASASICPTNWKLPTSNNTSTGSFGGLMNAYSITSSNVNDKIRQTPLYFIPAGYVDTDGLRFAGYEGVYWSSTPASSTSYAYYLYFRSGILNPSNNGNRYRYNGFSVRCLANTGAGTSDW